MMIMMMMVMMMMIIDGDLDVDVNLIVKPSPTILTSVVSSCPSRTGIKPYEKKLYLFFFVSMQRVLSDS